MKKAHFESAAPKTMDHQKRFAMTSEGPKVREAEPLVAPPAPEPPAPAKGKKSGAAAAVVALLAWLVLGAQAWAQFTTNAPNLNTNLGSGFSTNAPGSVSLPGTQFNTNAPSSTPTGLPPVQYAYPLLDTNGVIVWPLDFWQKNAAAGGVVPSANGSVSNLTVIGALIGNGGGLTNQIPGFFNVRDFGAVGQNAAKDSWAFTNAVAMAIAANGGIFIPPGNYYVTNTVDLSASQTRLPIHGSGMNVSRITFQGGQGAALFTNVVSVDLHDLSFWGGDVNVTNSCFVLRGDTFPSIMRNVQFAYFTGVAADFSGSAGMVIEGCDFLANHVGLRLPGYCDGADVSVRADENDVAVELGGPGASGYYSGANAVNGQRIHVMGALNIYGVVVGPGGGAVDVTGYMEQCFSAPLSIGHPQDFYNTYYGTNFYSFETNSYRNRLNFRLGYDGQLKVGGSYNTATGLGGHTGTRLGGWFRGQNLSGTFTNHVAVWMPCSGCLVTANDATTYSKNIYSDSAAITYQYSRGSFYTSAGNKLQINANGYGDGYAECTLNPPARNVYSTSSTATNVLGAATTAIESMNRRLMVGTGNIDYNWRSQLALLNTNTALFTLLAGGCGSGNAGFGYFDKRVAFTLATPISTTANPTGDPAAGMGLMEAVNYANQGGMKPDLSAWGANGTEYNSMIAYGSTLLSGKTSPFNEHTWWVNPSVNVADNPVSTMTLGTGVPAMALLRNGSLHVGTGSTTLALNPLYNSLYVDSNITAQASISCLGGVITNNGVVWLSTNNTPRGNYPAGSIATVSGGSAPGFYVQAVPGTWVGPK